MPVSNGGQCCCTRCHPQCDAAVDVKLLAERQSRVTAPAAERHKANGKQCVYAERLGLTAAGMDKQQQYHTQGLGDMTERHHGRRHKAECGRP